MEKRNNLLRRNAVIYSATPNVHPLPISSDPERLENGEEEKGNGEEAEETDDDNEQDEPGEEDFRVEAAECRDEVVLPHHHALPDTLHFDTGFMEIIRCMLGELKKNANSRALTPLWRRVCISILSFSRSACVWKYAYMRAW